MNEYSASLTPSMSESLDVPVTTVSPAELRTSLSRFGVGSLPVATPAYPTASCNGVTSTLPWPMAVFVMSPGTHCPSSGWLA